MTEIQIFDMKLNKLRKKYLKLNEQWLKIKLLGEETCWISFCQMNVLRKTHMYSE